MNVDNDDWKSPEEPMTIGARLALGTIELSRRGVEFVRISDSFDDSLVARLEARGLQVILQEYANARGTVYVYVPEGRENDEADKAIDAVFDQLGIQPVEVEWRLSDEA